MDVTPYLNFSGNCAEAFQFYQKLFGGTIVAMLTHGETPAKDAVPASWHAKIMHARLNVGASALMGSDVPPDRFTPASGVSITLTFDTPAEAERVFAGLAAQGRVTMPFQKTFWSPGFGMTTDRFGIPWMVNTAAAAAAV